MTQEIVLEREILEEVAVELNKVLFDPKKPEIDMTAPVDTLQRQIIEASELIEETDVISKQTQKVLKELEVYKSKGNEKLKKESDDEETSTEKSNTNELAIVVQETKKLKPLVDLVNKNDIFVPLRKNLKKYSGVQGPRQLKGRMLEILGVTSEKKAPREKKEPKPAYKRAQSVAEILSHYVGKDVPVKTVVTEADKLYSEKTGKEANEREGLAMFDKICVALAYFQLIQIDNDVITISKALVANVSFQNIKSTRR